MSDILYISLCFVAPIVLAFLSVELWERRKARKSLIGQDPGAFSAALRRAHANPGVTVFERDRILKRNIGGKFTPREVRVQEN